MFRKLTLLAALALAACEVPQDTRLPDGQVIADSALPPIKSFSGTPNVPATRSNADMARDFLDLSFQLESGRQLPRLTRFEGPITVRLAGTATATMKRDLTALVTRLRREAKINISEVSGASANITIHAVSRRDLRRALPNAACFVVPNVTDLADYRRNRGRAQTDWTQIQSRKKISIFLSYDTSPQDVRDCLHEELAQALGPLNDLFRLDDSVFNDNNFHSVLTGFDMLMLRAYYDPAIKNGMSREQAASRIGPILARINPRGASRPSERKTATPNAWKSLIITSLGSPGAAQRLNAASRAVNFAQDLGWTDNRLAFSHYALARQLRSEDLDLAKGHFERAAQIYRRIDADGPQVTHMDIQLAAYDISNGDASSALKRLGPAQTSAKSTQNAAQLASVLLLKSEALAMLGREQEAQSARLDSLGWARYGFGPDWAVRARMREIAALKPLNESSSQ